MVFRDLLDKGPRLRGGCVFPAVVLMSLIPNTVRAEDSAYCEKVRARARSDAALMFAPSLQLQAIHFPRNGLQDAGTERGQDNQLRGGLYMSLLDIYKGTLVRDVARADCARSLAHDQLLEFLARGAELVRAEALKRQLELLDSKEQATRELLAKAQERFAARVITLHEMNELTTLLADFERKRVGLRAEIGRSEVDAPVARPQNFESDKQALENASMRLEKKLVQLRSLDAWKVAMRGGLVADTPLDYYASLEVSYNLGGMASSARDADYLRARRKELKESRSELAHQASVFKAQLTVTREQVDGELKILVDQLRLVQDARQVLEGSQAPSAPHHGSVLALREIMLMAEDAYLTTYAEELAKL